MEITVYSTPTCGVCKMFKKKLTEKNIEFFAIDNEETTIAYGQQLGILAVPIIEIDGEIYDTASAAKKIGL